MSLGDLPQAVCKPQGLTTTSTALSLVTTKSETHGQTPTNPTNTRGGDYVFEEGEWWYLNGVDGGRRKADSQQARQNTRMWVDGKYIPKTHPLHKAGRYKGFEEAAFSSLANYDTSLEGQVYIISNPAWEGWIKVGMAVDAKDRLNNYQTSSPYRDYNLVYTIDTPDRRWTERKMHDILNGMITLEKQNEWFKIEPEWVAGWLKEIVEYKENLDEQAKG